MNIGTKIGKYEIRKKLGAGGMGEVFLAYDAQLHREIALKMLPAEFTQDEIRLHRFKQEARTISALNHPNIITIYEIGETEGLWFIATEYVKGVTLRQYLQDSPLTVKQALRFGEQIAQSLVAAHEAGIIHRDIKPENIMIRDDGYLKVLDFGLAKPTGLMNEGNLENSTSKFVNTTPGTVMGSVRYMSPEQTRGQQVDGRTDIWSLGILLYEMVSKWTPFEGATASDTLAAVIHFEPVQLTQLAPNIPLELERIVHKALQKNVAERYQNSKEIQLDLKNLLYEVEHEFSLEHNTQVSVEKLNNSENPTIIHQTLSQNHPTQISVGLASKTENVGNPVKQYKLITLLSIIALFGFLAMCFFGYQYLANKSNQAETNFDKTKVSLLESDGRVRLTTISADGKYLAYVSGEAGNRSLVVRQIAANSLVTIVPPNSLDFISVRFSPSGDYVYYTQVSKNQSFNTLYQIPTLGGTPKKLIEDIDSPVTFSPDGKQIAFRRHVSNDSADFIFIANADGTNLQELTNTKQTEFTRFVNPAWSPKGNTILVGVGKIAGGIVADYTLAEISVADKTIKPVSEKKWFSLDSYSWFSDGAGFLVAGQEVDGLFSQIWSVAYPSGEIKSVTNDSNNYFNLGYSEATNTIVAVRNDNTQGLWSFDSTTKDFTQLIPERRNFIWDSRLSQLPGGELVFSRRENNEINFLSLNPNGTNEKLILSDKKAISNPVTTPDGKYIVFASTRSSFARIWRVNPDGSNLIQLTDSEEVSGDYHPNITSDGKKIVFIRVVGKGEKNILATVSIDGGKVETLFDEPNYIPMFPKFSPDGKYLVFMIYNKTAFDRKLRIYSLNENTIHKLDKEFEYSPIDNFSWSPDSKSLTYLKHDGVSNLWKLSIADGKSTPITEFKTGRIFNFLWSRDGKSIFIIRGIINNDLVLIRNDQ